MTSCSWASNSKRLINDSLWHTNNQGALGPFGLAVTDDNEAEQRAHVATFTFSAFGQMCPAFVKTNR